MFRKTNCGWAAPKILVAPGGLLTSVKRLCVRKIRQPWCLSLAIIVWHPVVRECIDLNSFYDLCNQQCMTSALSGQMSGKYKVSWPQGHDECCGWIVTARQLLWPVLCKLILKHNVLYITSYFQFESHKLFTILQCRAMHHWLHFFLWLTSK